MYITIGHQEPDDRDDLADGPDQLDRVHVPVLATMCTTYGHTYLHAYIPTYLHA